MVVWVIIERQNTNLSKKRGGKMEERKLDFRNRTVFEAIRLVQENGLAAKDVLASSSDVTKYFHFHETESCVGRVICIPLIKEIPREIILVLTDGEISQPDPEQDLYCLVYREKNEGIKWVLGVKMEILRIQEETTPPEFSQANSIA
jgi:hypothetical protein